MSLRWGRGSFWRPVSQCLSDRFTTFWLSLISFRVEFLQLDGPIVAMFIVTVLVAIAADRPPLQSNRLAAQLNSRNWCYCFRVEGPRRLSVATTRASGSESGLSRLPVWRACSTLLDVADKLHRELIRKQEPSKWNSWTVQWQLQTCKMYLNFDVFLFKYFGKVVNIYL